MSCRISVTTVIHGGDEIVPAGRVQTNSRRPMVAEMEIGGFLHDWRACCVPRVITAFRRLPRVGVGGGLQNR